MPFRKADKTNDSGYVYSIGSGGSFSDCISGSDDCKGNFGSI